MRLFSQNWTFVADAQGRVRESYVYDPTGNILQKTVDGKTTKYTYDKANQLVSSETEGRVTKYAYDAAGRLIQEGDKSYTYAWLDKLMSVSEAGKVSANFDYHPDGQIASVTYADGRRENYLWDGLALIHRNGTDILNEPAITGGNPVLSGDKVLFNDLLGNTLGVKDQSSYQPIRMTAFGESDNADAFFTGKPLVGELGYAFLFRNYRPEQGKWQTADPLGYPDGWNSFAYVNNGVTMAIDWLGAAIILTGFRNLQGTGGSIAYHSMRYFRVSENEYAQLSERSRTYAPWEQTVDGNGNTVYDLTIAGHQTEVGNYLEIRYNDQSDQLQNMNEARSVSLNPDVSQIDFIDSFIDASANYRGNYWAEYDARPDWYGNENSGNCNSIQSMLEQIAGGTTPNIPDKAYGWNHLMSMSFFE